MAEIKTQLRQWPVQMHLISPMAPYFKKADVVLAADCAAYAYGNFHNDFIKGKKLIIACPKLDSEQDIYRFLADRMLESPHSWIVYSILDCQLFLHARKQHADE